MAGSFSDYQENQVLTTLRGTALWVGLLTVQPADAGTGASPQDGTEATGASYARQPIAATTGWSAITALASTTRQHMTNAAVITFPKTGASESWGTITGYCLYDAVTAGNARAYADLNPTEAVGANTTFSLGVGVIDVQCD